jgi:hypothetical protein
MHFAVKSEKFEHPLGILACSANPLWLHVTPGSRGRVFHTEKVYMHKRSFSTPIKSHPGATGTCRSAHYISPTKYLVKGPWNLSQNIWDKSFPDEKWNLCHLDSFSGATCFRWYFYISCRYTIDAHTVSIGKNPRNNGSSFQEFVYQCMYSGLADRTLPARSAASH